MSNRVTRSTKPVKRYTRKKDALGRIYTIDRKTGKRASNSQWQREQKKIARVREKARQAEIRSERALRAAETRRRNQEIREENARRRSERAIRGWETRKKRSLDVIARIEDEFLSPLKPDSIQGKIVSPFIPVERLGPEFGMSLKQKVHKYAKVRMRTLASLIYAGSESQKIAPLIARDGYIPSPEEWIRACLFNAYTGDSTEFSSFESAAGAMAEQFDKPLREVYEIFFSPSVA